jgi:hypothetical protein
MKILGIANCHVHDMTDKGIEGREETARGGPLPPTAWPAWTDDDRWVPSDTETFNPTAEDAAWWDTQTREPAAPRTTLADPELEAKLGRWIFSDNTMRKLYGPNWSRP